MASIRLSFIDVYIYTNVYYAFLVIHYAFLRNLILLSAMFYFVFMSSIKLTYFLTYNHSSVLYSFDIFDLIFYNWLLMKNVCKFHKHNCINRDKSHR